jgi:thioredoxin-related protein
LYCCEKRGIIYLGHVEELFMKKIILVTFLLLSVCLSLHAGEELDKYYAALAQAKREKKVVYVVFRSRGCCACKSLSRNVLSNREFKKYAKKHLVLVLLKPTPSRYSSDSEYGDQMKLDRMLKSGSSNYLPYAFLVKPNGKVLGKISGTANCQKYIEQIDAVLKGKQKPEKE